MSEVITGRNAVLEALKSGREIDKITVVKGAEGSVKKIAAIAREKKIPLYYSEKNAFDRIAPGEHHQGVIAAVSDYVYCSIEDMIRKAEKKNEAPFLVILDGIEDPHNLGAIMRTAECAGAHGVIIPKRRSVSVNDTVYKTSAGAVEYVMCARVTNLAREIEALKKRGIWTAACDMDGSSVYESYLSGPVAVVVGGEGSGISRLVKEKCDFTVSIPMKGNLNSLNASNAAAITMYEIVRQRGIR